MPHTSSYKADLSEIISSYKSATKMIEELRDENVVSAQDCDNIFGHLNSGMMEDVLLYVRSYMMQTSESAVVKTKDEYLKVKGILERQNLKQDEAKEILSLFFKASM